jgi:hypothetical protein
MPHGKKTPWQKTYGKKTVQETNSSMPRFRNKLFHIPVSKKNTVSKKANKAKKRL